jgi:hypothetical protein
MYVHTYYPCRIRSHDPLRQGLSVIISYDGNQKGEYLFF